MGMSASQARLLTLTSRMSDLELQAQQISNAKIRLSQNSQEAAETYNNALSKETLQVYVGVDTDTQDGEYISATASNLTTYGAISTTDPQRFLRNSSGQILVSEDIKTAYDASGGDLKTFLTKVGCSDKEIITTLNSETLKTIKDLITSIQGSTLYSTEGTPNNSVDSTLNSNIIKLANALVKLGASAATISGDGNYYNTAIYVANALADRGNDSSVISELTDGNITEDNRDLLQYLIEGDTEGTVNSALVNTTSDATSILNSYNSVDNSKAEYYEQVFEKIKENGCFTASDTEMNNADWLYAQLSSGGLTLVEQSTTDDSDGDGEKDWKDVSWSSGDSTLKSDTDDEAIARAEAKYDSEMAEINTKDQRFDLQLKNVDTEHNAVQTEFDTVKKVIEKNVERSMKLFNA